MREIANILRQFNAKQRLLVLVVILFFITVGAVADSYFKNIGCEQLIEQNQELVQTIVNIEKTITDYKEIVAEVENDPCLTEGAAASIIDSAVTGSDSYTETGYQDPSMVIMDSVLIITSKVIK